MRPGRIIFFLFLFSNFPLTAQQKSIKFDKLSIENGLSQSSVTTILQDDNGFIWIATQDGLNRYNGYEFEIFKNDPHNPKSIPNNYIHDLVQDKEGNLWFGTNRGIGKINPQTLDIEKVNRSNYPELRGYVFIDIAFDEKGYLWALSDKHGINRIDLTSKRIDVISTVSGSQEFSAIHLDQQERLWVGTKTGEVFYSSPPYDYFSQIDYNDIFSLSGVNKFTDYQGQLMVCSESGIYRISDSDKLQLISTHPFLRVSNINYAYVEDSANTWVGTTEHGLILLQKDKNGQQQLYQYKKNPYDPSSISDDGINTIYEDESGVFWLGTEKGICKFDKYKQGFTTISINTDARKGLIDYTVWSFAEDSLGHIYVGTQKDLTIYDSRRKRFHHIIRDRNEQRRLLKIYPETSNKIWCGYEDGLFLLTITDLNAGRYSFEKIKFLDKDISRKIVVYQIEPADPEHLWIGSKAGLSLLNKTTLEYEFYESTGGSQGLGEGSVKNIYRDMSGKIWLITSNQGLYNIIEKADGTFYFRHIPIIQHDESNSHITSILQTERNSLWLGTYGEGIKHLNLRSKRTVNYTETQGLSNNVVYGLLEDEEGNIWASTNKGISKFNPKSERFTTFGVKDGLQSNEFNTNAYMKSSKGQLYFGGINGYNIFNPKEININPHPPKVVVSKVIMTASETGERDVVLSNVLDSVSINLSYQQNDLYFEFFSTNFSNPEKTRYKLKLEGIEDEFVYLDKENHKDYQNLSHGSYRFEIYAQSADGVWSEKPAIIAINIAPPFWLTWWFRILIILLATAIGLLFYRRRVDTIRRQKVRLEIEVVKRTRQITEQSKKLHEQKQRVEIQNKKIEHQKELLEKEKEKVEQLLLNILPEGTAEELKNKGRSKARYYRNVSVLFTDFVGFSKIAEDMKPQELVQQLDGYFSVFDEIIEKYDLEKIKTIGDSYMCAGGVPIRNKSNAIEVTLAALEIKNYMNEREKEDKEEGRNSWKIRIGINTGEVIAGVIGLKRFAYDIWGATVNQAQRMEMHGQPGTVNVSGNTYEYIAPYFECTYRGKIQTKHKGMLDMFYVKGIKPELSENNEGKIPNSKFWKIVDLHLYSAINYMKAERHIMKILETQLSPKLLYHSINHTIDVTQAVERLAIMEGITDEDLFLLKSAATYHDAGFVEQYEDNEEIGMRLAREILPKYGYTQEQIDVIDGLISATKIPQSPTTHLQQIMCDADLDYLGRDDFHDIASLLRRELREHGKLDSDRKWDEIQLAFLNQHTYFTDSAIRLRQEKKEKHIAEIEVRLNTYSYKD